MGPGFARLSFRKFCTEYPLFSVKQRTLFSSEASHQTRIRESAASSRLASSPIRTTRASSAAEEFFFFGGWWRCRCLGGPPPLPLPPLPTRRERRERASSGRKRASRTQREEGLVGEDDMVFFLLSLARAGVQEEEVREGRRV